MLPYYNFKSEIKGKYFQAGYSCIELGTTR
jgi:hypothetical protein